MRGLYTLAIHVYGWAISLASLFQKKAAGWKQGRKELIERLPNDLKGCIWVHCASLGEFEQGRPVIEALKEQTDKRILLTFFSPSGYEIRKNYPLADAVTYLPLDTRSNARRFLERVKPIAAIFVKYEVWHNFFREAQHRNIPVYMISAIFRREQIYFRPYGKWFLNTLSGVKHIFCQDEFSANLLKDRGIEQVTVSGDTRFDRVLKLAQSADPITEIETWLGNRRAILVGSSWPEDEKMLVSVLDDLPEEVAIIIAPHEISKTGIDRLKALLVRVDVFSDDRSRDQPGKVMIIDTIGILGRLYQYADLAYIGGGFGAGIHNTLEAAVYGIPVIFGPKFENFREAIGLHNAGAGFSVNNGKEFHQIFFRLLKDDTFRIKAGKAARNYIESEAGATEIIVHKLLSEF